MKTTGLFLNLTCPRCGEAGSRLGDQRIRRRIVDRLLGVLRSSHRYRCRTAGCNWAGNRSSGRGQQQKSGRSGRAFEQRIAL